MQQKILNNRYELEQKIGEGGMARVYRGRDLRLNRSIAVKVLHSHYATDAGFLQRFHHEAQAAANLRHPNIVDVYDVGQDGDIHYIVMEYVEGSDLKAVIARNGPLPIEQAVAIAEAVARALEAAHRIGLVHRDIKPQNIIVGPQGQVKITDFGIAKSNLSTAMTDTGVTFGTADYISPEQARGQPATPRSDIYSLGVTLYEMLTGRLPFTGDSAIGVAMQHVSTEPPPPRMYNPRIPPRLEALVLSALSKDPNDRPVTAQEFARLLSGYREVGEQETVIRPQRPAPARPQPQPVAPQPRATLPPSRPAVIAQQKPSSGMGFGGFVLSLLLLLGVIGLVYLFLIGTFNDLFNDLFNPTIGITSPTAVVPTDTAPTTEPTGMPLVSVPNVVGQDEQAALAALRAVGLTPQAGTPRNSSDAAAGQVIEQSPAANSSLPQTSVVTYVLSLGAEVVDVPNVTLRRAGDAQAELERAGFKVQVQQEASANVDEGFVIRQQPFAGARVSRGDTITLVVSIGNKVVMPDVRGLSEEQAKQIISAAGLFVSFSDYQGRDKLGSQFDKFAPFTVISTLPAPGVLVPRGSGVTLGVRAP
jgi:serine/threonine-protein kinase